MEFLCHLQLPPLLLAENGTLIWEPRGIAPFTINLEAVGSNNVSALLQLHFTLCRCSRSQECDYSNTVTLRESSLQVVCQKLLWQCTEPVPVPAVLAVFSVHPSSSHSLSQCHYPLPSWQPADARAATQVPSARTPRTPARRDASLAWDVTLSVAVGPARLA